jgi:pyruvate/2-oxoglutarate dehydrogenase complex dihydrolipoamide acyltransferase (E2) component
MQDDFNGKTRERFRKLLELARSSGYEGERTSALAAAARLADRHGMSIEEAAGMAERYPVRPQDRRPSAEETAFTTAASMTNASQRAEKERYMRARAEAIKRGLDAEEVAGRGRRVPKQRFKPPRNRPKREFIRVLLRETRFSVAEIAATVGVPVNDVFKEKLLMRSA